MEKEERKQYASELKSIIKDLTLASNKLPYEDRFDVASLKNNIYNASISFDIDYLYRFYETYVGSKIVNAFDYLKEREDGFIKSHFEDVDELKDRIIELVRHLYIEDNRHKHNEKWVEKHLKPVIAHDKVNIITMFKKENRNKETFKMVFLGNQERKGVIPAIVIYSLLVLFGFIFIYPILYMIAKSFMSTQDLLNPSVKFVPSSLEWINYVEAWKVLDYPKVFLQTMLVSVLPSICQTIVCALTGWGIARYEFKGKKILFALIIFTFLIPSSLTMFPTIEIHRNLHITGTVFAYVIPALLGQGFKSAVFILIFYQYFKAIPKTIIEAAEIDGANTFTIFLKIGIPSALSAVLLTVLLSIVWYYNETVLTSVFFGSTISTLPLGIQSFEQSFTQNYGTASGTSYEAVVMAGTILNMLPLVVLYFFTQKFFVQGMDKAGITGE